MSISLDAKNLMHEQEEATTIYCDNKTTITLSKNHVFHKRTKNIDAMEILVFLHNIVKNFKRTLVNPGEKVIVNPRREGDCGP
jgi:hypothetical protein